MEKPLNTVGQVGKHMLTMENTATAAQRRFGQLLAYAGCFALGGVFTSKLYERAAPETKDQVKKIMAVPYAVA